MRFGALWLCAVGFWTAAALELTSVPRRTTEKCMAIGARELVELLIDAERSE